VPVARALERDFPADADVLYEAARLHMKAWNDVVFQMFQKTPASYRVNQISAEIFEIQGRYADAVAEYRKAIEKNPTAINLHFRLGRALLLHSHSPDALLAARKEFEAELKLNPSDAVAEYEIGQILVAQNKPREAAPRFERALAQSPDFTEALLAVAKLRADAKRYDEAIPLLERAVKLQPANESAHYNLMLAYRNAGRTADAEREKAEVDKLKRPPSGEFTEFLKKLGEKAPSQ
jgi:tetratricopeptide (TPR) repeat protein